MDNEVLKTGTTTIGIVCKDGIVMAADKRATAGHLVAHKKEQKLHQIAPSMVVAMAGLVSDAQLLVKLIRAEIKLKEIQTGRPVKVKEASSLLGGLLYSNIRRPSMIASIVAFLLGGADDDGYHLYNLGIDGSITRNEEWETNGSGSVFAMGVLETHWKKGLSTDDGIELALKAVNAALQRDSATGNGVDIYVIDDKGARLVFTKQIDTGIQA